MAWKEALPGSQARMKRSGLHDCKGNGVFIHIFLCSSSIWDKASELPGAYWG